jgi:iron complex transport system permease protein
VHVRLHQTIFYLVLIVAWLAACAASLWAGTCGVPFTAAWQDLALPRLIIGMLAGAALAVAGAMFQSLFRNPLASPYTLGVSSGASLGAAIAFTLFGGGRWYGLPVVSVAAFVGALLSVSIVYGVARLRQGHSTATLLLAGITIGFISSALIVLVMYLAEIRDSDRILRWMMGSLEIVGFNSIYESLAFLAVAGGIAFYLHRELDLLMMGEVLAESRGVSVRRSRRLIYFSASLLTAAIVAYCGPIGFVGLLVPHMVRFFVGPTHRYLLPGCAIAGASFLTLSDVLARNAMWWLREESRQIPVGVLTNLVGGAFFIYLLLTRRNDQTLV